MPLRSSFQRGMICSLEKRRGLNPVIKTGFSGRQVLLYCIGYGNKRIHPHYRQRFYLHTQSLLAFLAMKLPTRIFTSVALYGLYVPAGQAVIVVEASGQKYLVHHPQAYTRVLKHPLIIPEQVGSSSNRAKIFSIIFSIYIKNVSASHATHPGGQSWH